MCKKTPQRFINHILVTLREWEWTNKHPFFLHLCQMCHKEAKWSLRCIKRCCFRSDFAAEGEPPEEGGSLLLPGQDVDAMAATASGSRPMLESSVMNWPQAKIKTSKRHYRIKEISNEAKAEAAVLCFSYGLWRVFVLVQACESLEARWALMCCCTTNQDVSLKNGSPGPCFQSFPDLLFHLQPVATWLSCKNNCNVAELASHFLRVKSNKLTFQRVTQHLTATTSSQKFTAPGAEILVPPLTLVWATRTIYGSVGLQRIHCVCYFLWHV